MAEQDANVVESAGTKARIVFQSAEEEAALKELEQLWPTNVSIGPGNKQKRMLRFLRHHKLNVSHTVAGLREHLNWRKQWDLDNIKINDVALHLRNIGMYTCRYKNLDGEDLPMFSSGAHYMFGRDKSPPFETTLAMIYVMEVIERENPDCDAPYFMVANLELMKMGDYDNKLEKMAFQVYSLNYPGRVKNFIAVNSPRLLRIILALAKTWLPKEMAQGMSATSGREASRKSFVERHHVDLSTIPVSIYGDREYDVESFIRERAEIEGIDPDSPGKHVVSPRLKLAWGTGFEVPANELDNVSLCGYGHKRTKAFHIWKHYYIAIQDSVLLYFKNETKTVPNNGILLENCRVDEVTKETNKPFAFVLITPYRKYLFRMDSQEEKTKWMKGLEDACEQATKNSLEKLGVNVESMGEIAAPEAF